MDTLLSSSFDQLLEGYRQMVREAKMPCLTPLGYFAALMARLRSPHEADERRMQLREEKKSNLENRDVRQVERGRQGQVLQWQGWKGILDGLEGQGQPGGLQGQAEGLGRRQAATYASSVGATIYNNDCPKKSDDKGRTSDR